MLKKKDGNNEIKSTSHSRYRVSVSHSIHCTEIQKKRNIWNIEKDIGVILRKLCEQKGVEIIQAEAHVDHVHMLVSIPPYMSVAQFMDISRKKAV